MNSASASGMNLALALGMEFLVATERNKKNSCSFWNKGNNELHQSFCLYPFYHQFHVCLMPDCIWGLGNEGDLELSHSASK
jgi:hypothetical protein